MTEILLDNVTDPHLVKLVEAFLDDEEAVKLFKKDACGKICSSCISFRFAGTHTQHNENGCNDGGFL